MNSCMRNIGLTSPSSSSNDEFAAGMGFAMVVDIGFAMVMAKKAARGRVNFIVWWDFVSVN